MDIKESDWKIFKEVREITLQRFCDRILSEIKEIVSDTSKTSHERYSEIYRHIHARDKDIATAFNGLSRSRALLQLHSIKSLDLLTKEESERFGPEVQEFFTRIKEINSPGREHQSI